MKTTIVFAVALFLPTLSRSANAQWQVGPIYPQKPGLSQVSQSGYDPFQLNWSTGRFDYVPTPYAAEPAGANYNPYRLNIYSGRWDYVPVPAPSDAGMDTRAYEAAPVRLGAVPTSGALMPLPRYQDNLSLSQPALTMGLRTPSGAW